MAVSLGTPTQMAATTGQSPSFSHTHVAGTELLVFVAGRRSSNIAISSVTYDGAAMTAVETSPNSGATSPLGVVAAYRLADPGGKTATVQINWGASIEYTVAFAIDVSGAMAGAALIDSSGSAAVNNISLVTVTHTRVAADTVSVYFASRTKGVGSPSWSPTAPLVEILEYDGPVNSLSNTLDSAQESAAGSLARVSTCSTSGGTAALCVSIATSSSATAGDLAATLGALSLSGSAKLDIQGALTATLGALTLSATSRDGKGDLSRTLGALTLSGSAKLDIRATLAATLGALTVTATGGAVVFDRTANLSRTLGALTLSSASKLAISGSASATLGDVTASSAGKLAIKGTLAATLGAMTLNGAGVLPIKGTLTRTLGALTLAGHGIDRLETHGALTVTLGGLSLVSAAKLRERQQVIPRSLLSRPNIPSVKRTKVGYRGVRRFR